MGYEPPATMPPWRTVPGLGGGFTIEIQVHEFDIVTWFGGAPISVRGVVSRADPAFPTLDTGMSAVVTYRDEVVGHVTGSWLSRIWASHRGIIGTRGTIVIDAWDHLRFAGERAATVRDEEIVPTRGPDDAVRAEDEHFLRCIARDKEPLVSGEAGMTAVELALACIASSEENVVIILPRAH
jgi:predicted dehydrogenase